jgi:hypothetical protein
MRYSWMMIALTLSLTAASAGALEMSVDYDVFEDDGGVYPGWLCEACRDPADHAFDYAAYSYNAYWGEDPWAFESRLGMPFRVYNRDGEWVVVWFEQFLLDSISLMPSTMDVLVRLPTGEIVTFVVLKNGPDMLVGEPDPVTEFDTGETSDGGGDDEEDYADDEESYEYEEPELNGIVEILDPDDDGEFPDWLEEL